MHLQDFVVSGQKFTGFFFAERGLRNCCRHISFQILDVSISSGVIRDQILKLTLI